MTEPPLSWSRCFAGDTCALDRVCPFFLDCIDAIDVGEECPHCGDTYHNLPEHYQLDYKGCGTAKRQAEARKTR